MTKYTIETDDETEMRMLIAGPRLAAALWEYSEALRQKIKYGDEQPGTTWEQARELFSEYCDEVMGEIEVR